MSMLIALGPQSNLRLAAMVSPTDTSEAHWQQQDLKDFSVRVAQPDPNDPRNQREQGISQAQGVTLALDGYVLDLPQRGEALRLHLIKLFLAKGEHFVNGLAGCFLIALHHQGETRIYSDRVGMRPLFLASDNEGPILATATAPLLLRMPRRSLDGANLLQFLAAGRFFVGGTVYRELRLAPPGTLYHFRQNHLTTRSWYTYAIEAVPQDAECALLQLGDLLDQAVSRHYCYTKGRSLMLSGGYDSRYLLNSLVALYGYQHGVFAWLWCEQNDHPESDLSWARREAARQQTHFEDFPVNADLAQNFQNTFDAMSGMIEQVFTHTDERTYCRMLHREHGLRSMFRGDEIFGANGKTMHHQAEALASVGLIPLDQFGDASEWLRVPNPLWQEEHRQHLQFLAQGETDPNDLRDRLYCQERLPSLQAHLNAQRLPYLETHNPMLDPDLLEFVRHLPAPWRTDKRLFRELFLRRFPTPGFASVGNGFDWGRVAKPSGIQAPFMREHLQTLPDPLNRAKFLGLFDAACKGELPLDPPPGPTKTLPPLKLVARAMILGQWLRRWPLTH